MKTQHWALREGGQKAVRCSRRSQPPCLLPAPAAHPTSSPFRQEASRDTEPPAPQQPAHPDLASPPQPSSTRRLPPVLCPAASCLIPKVHVHKPQAL